MTDSIDKSSDGPKGPGKPGPETEDLTGILKRAVQLHGAGRLREASDLYGRILEVRPDHAEALHLLGVLAHQREQFDAAVNLIGRAIEIEPGNPLFHNNLGLALASSGRLDDAVLAYGEAVRLLPSLAEAHSNLGNALREQGRFREALGELREAVRLRPEIPGTRCNLGNALRDLGLRDEAVEEFRTALSLDPGFAEAWFNLGNTLKDRGLIREAIENFSRALKIRPAFPSAHNNLGNALQDLGRTGEAVACFREAIRLSPGYAEAHNNLGTALRDQGDIQGAMESFEEAIALRPDYPGARFNRAITLLLKGDLEEGWKGWNRRFQEQRWRVTYPHRHGAPAWDGSSFQGRRLFVRDEQGIGDTLQFVRYLPLVKARGGTVIFETKRTLLRLLKGFPGIDEMVEQAPEGETWTECDLEVSLMSLPKVFGTTLGTIPCEIPYLHADPGLAESWKRRLEGQGLKVGLVWAGKTGTHEQRRRSLTFESLAPLLKVPGVRFYALQRGLSGMKTGPYPAGITANLGDQLEDFADTAGVIANLDLLISVDTSAAHLAGAMGRRVWVMLPMVPDWRWFLHREDSPWYPTMRLFRQDRGGDWEGVLERVVRRLRAGLDEGLR